MGQSESNIQAFIYLLQSEQQTQSDSGFLAFPFFPWNCTRKRSGELVQKGARARGIKLIFTRGHISLTVAFKGLNIILGLHKCNYFLTRGKEFSAAAGQKQGAGLGKTRWRVGFSPWALCFPSVGQVVGDTSYCWCSQNKNLLPFIELGVWGGVYV